MKLLARPLVKLLKQSSFENAIDHVLPHNFDTVKKLGLKRWKNMNGLEK